MRNLFLLCLCAAILYSSCKKTGSLSFIIPGTYTGTFQRQISGTGEVSNVTIDFTRNTFNGSSEFPHYPAICHGTYKSSGRDSVAFQDECVWPADFDWSLILSGKYQIKISNDSLKISRKYSNSVKDVYLLERQ